MQKMQETWVGSLGKEEPLEGGNDSTPVFLPRESHGKRNLVGLQGLDMTERVRTHTHTHTHIHTHTSEYTQIHIFPMTSSINMTRAVSTLIAHIWAPECHPPGKRSRAA